MKVAKKIEIALELHKDGTQLILDGSDITKFVPDTTEKDAEFILYIEKWCQYLNCQITDNKEMAFGNVELARLDGWITGYETAKGYVSDTSTNCYVVITAGKYVIKIPKPLRFSQRGESKRNA